MPNFAVDYFEFMLFAHLYCTHVWGHGTGMWSSEDDWSLVSAKEPSLPTLQYSTKHRRQYRLLYCEARYLLVSE